MSNFNISLRHGVIRRENGIYLRPKVDCTCPFSSKANSKFPLPIANSHPDLQLLSCHHLQRRERGRTRDVHQKYVYRSAYSQLINSVPSLMFRRNETSLHGRTVPTYFDIDDDKLLAIPFGELPEIYRCRWQVRICL